MSETRVCDVCGRPLRRDNTAGVCHGQYQPECRKEYRRRRNSLGREEPKNCKVCGKKLNRNNQSGFCHSNPECIREHRRRWYETNPDAQREHSRRWREANPEAARENSRRWAEANPDAQRERHRRWAEANPEAIREYSRRRRAFKRGLPEEKIGRQELHDLYGGLCGICGEPVEDKWEVDHIVPIVKGGWHVRVNVQPAHPRCNQSKNDKLDWNRATIRVIVMMLNQLPEGYTVELAKGSFVTRAAVTKAA